MQYKFTIFTPCYNAENTIHRVFQSVEGQTYDNFEWIIINDGSIDGSDNVIRELIKLSPISDKIKYFVQQNMGKHLAWNKALDFATGELFLSADADDTFIPETLAYFNDKINDVIGEDERLSESSFSGINVCCYDPENGKRIGSIYPYDGIVSDNIELKYKYKISGEHWGVVRTDLLRRNKFPEGKGHFWTEGRIWFSFAMQGFKVVCFNDCLRARYTETTSLTHNKRYRYNKEIQEMYLQNNLWVIKHCGSQIFKYSKKGYFVLCKNIASKFVKYIIASALRK